MCRLDDLLRRLFSRHKNSFGVGYLTFCDGSLANTNILLASAFTPTVAFTHNKCVGYMTFCVGYLADTKMVLVSPL